MRLAPAQEVERDGVGLGLGEPARGDAAKAVDLDRPAAAPQPVEPDPIPARIVGHHQEVAEALGVGGDAGGGAAGADDVEAQPVGAGGGFRPVVHRPGRVGGDDHRGHLHSFMLDPGETDLDRPGTRAQRRSLEARGKAAACRPSARRARLPPRGRYRSVRGWRRACSLLRRCSGSGNASTIAEECDSSLCVPSRRGCRAAGVARRGRRRC